MAQAVAGEGKEGEGKEGEGRNGVAAHDRLGAAWRLDGRGRDLLRRALVLCADHELNASAYAARVVASTGASLAACVLAGLAALSGPRHGGMTDRVRALAADPEVRRDPVRALGARLARGEEIPGFGHRLYPRGDPRAMALLDGFPVPESWRAMIRAAEALTGLRPTVDVALALMEEALPLPAGGGLGIFAIGSFFAGTLVERWGARNSAAAAFIVQTLALLGGAAAGMTGVFVAAFFIVMAVQPVVYVALRTSVTQLTEGNEGTAFGWFGLASDVGWILGPIVAGALFQGLHGAVLLVLAAVTIAGLLTIWRTSTTQHTAPAPSVP